MGCRCRLVSISYELLSPFHGGNTGSNPVGDAIKTKQLCPPGEWAFFIGGRYGDEEQNKKGCHF